MASLEDSQPISAREGFDIQDVDIAEYWKMTIEKCNVVAGWNLDVEKRPITEDEIRAKLVPEKTKKQEIALKAATGFQVALGVVNTLGQIIGSTASSVVGPANQAANAISFVVGAIQNYNAVIADVADIMERLSDFLTRVEYYVKEGINSELRVTVYKVMDHFLYIMAAIYKLRGNWKNKLILAAKTTIIGKNTTIKDATDRFELLVERHARRQMDVLSNDVRSAGTKLTGLDTKLGDVADDTKHMVGVIDKAAAANEKKERYEKITKSLKLESQAKVWLERQDQQWARAKAPDTGKWLAESSEYTAWCDTDTDQRLLLIEAESGHGKSVLASYIIRQLQVKCREKSDSLLAYYFFQQEEAEDAINLALRSVILQLAVLGEGTLYNQYSRFAEKVCQDTPDVDDIAKLWKAFILDTSKPSPIDGTLYIVLDGLDEIKLNDPGRAGVAALKAIIDGLSENKRTAKGLQVHVCLTARREGMRSVELDTSPNRIVLGIQDDTPGGSVYPNKSDLDSYIRSRLRGMTIFQVKNAEVNQILQELETTLADNVRGDYSKLSFLLDLIEKSIAVDDVREVAKRAHNSRDEIIRAQIKALNQRLSKSEIAEVNEMLTWARCAMRPLTVNQYQDILTTTSERTVLIDLEKQIRDRYTMFDVDEDKRVTLHFDDWFSSDKDEDTATLFEKGEVELVRQLLRTHFQNIYGSNGLYVKYGFDDFLNDLPGTGTLGIQINLKYRPDLLSRACIATIRANDQENLVQYCRRYFIWHLDDYIDNDALSSSKTQQSIDEDLVAVLQDTSLIEAWLDVENVDDETELWQVFYGWRLVALQKWFKPSEDSSRGWFDTIVTEEDSDIAALINVAKCMARHWLSLGTKWKSALEWLRNYVAQHKKYSNSSVKAVASWAHLNIEATDAQWNVCLAESFLQADEFKQAAKKYRKAISLGPSTPELQLGLAKSLVGHKDFEEAISILQVLQVQLTDGDRKDATETNMLDEVTSNLARCFTTTQRYQDSVALLQKRLEKLMDNPEVSINGIGEVVVPLVKALHAAEQYEAIFKTLMQLQDANKLVDLVGWHSYAFIFEAHLWHAAEQLNATQDLVQVYEEVLHSNLELYDRLTMRISMGISRWPRCSASERDEIVALWEQNLDPESPYVVSTTVTTEVLAVAYVDIVRDSGWQKPLVTLYASKLREFMRTYKDEWRTDVTLLLGRLYHCSGDDENARDCLRLYLKEGLKLMDDMATRQEALFRIGAVAQVMDDDLNAVAAWQMLRPAYPQPDVEKTVPAGDVDAENMTTDDDDWLSLASDDDPADTAPVHSWCDGRCDKCWAWVGQEGDVWNCKDCIDVQFEASCYQQLKASTLIMSKACNPRHQHLRVPSLRDDQIKGIPPDELWVGDKLMHKDEWVERIKVAWELDDKSLALQEERQKEAVGRLWRRKTASREDEGHSRLDETS